MKKNYIGIDIGGTKIEGILWRAGKIVAHEKYKTPQTRAKFLSELAKLITALSAGGKIAGIGIGVAGILNSEKGIVIDSIHMPFLNGFNLAVFLKQRFRAPVKIDNDARCFLLGELRFGASRGKQNVVALTLGTGLGGAVLDHGRIIRGAHDAAQLTGLILSEKNGEFLNFQDLVSEHGFKRLGIKDPLEYQNRAFAGDKRAKKIYDLIGKNLGIGCSIIARVFDPELIVIGGGIARAGELLLAPAKKEMSRRLKNAKQPEIKISKLKNAALLGAVGMFL